MYYFTPLPGCFSPFPHGTSSLSVACKYLAFRGGPRRFAPAFPDPALLGRAKTEIAYLSRTGLLPTAVCRSRTLLLDSNFVTLREVWCPLNQLPTTPAQQCHQA